MAGNLPVLNTPERIAERLDRPLSLVLEFLESTSDIRPRAIASHLRIYDEPAVDLIREQLGKADALQSGEA